MILLGICELILNKNNNKNSDFFQFSSQYPSG